MADYNINGQLCIFPGVPYAALAACNNGLGASPRTFLLAWKKAPTCHQIAIMAMLHSLHELGGLEQPPYIVEDTPQRTIILLEHPNKTMMQHVIDWLGTCVGLNYRYICPYRDKLAEEIRQGDEKIKDIDNWLSYHKHPLYLEWKKQQSAGNSLKITPNSLTDLKTKTDLKN